MQLAPRSNINKPQAVLYYLPSILGLALEYTYPFY
jgi:hypothetical protein